MGTLLSLTPDQKQFFDENGYLVVEGLYPPQEITTMREQMNTLLRHPESARPGVKFSCEPEEEREAHPLDPDNPHRVWMVFDLPLAGDYWFRQFTDPRVVAIVSDLLGPNINFHNGKARIKPPGTAAHLIWHQDWPYERHTEPDLVAALTYLDDVDENAAGTRVVPGTHRQGEWPHDDQNAIAPALVEAFVKQSGKPPVTLRARAGTVLFIHVQAIHAASPNQTNRNRSVIINEYKTMETLDRWGNKCALAELPLMRGGRPFFVTQA
jgi:ectoine hydroxylase-related dioxygenase (phytanoyl-CoA dioxygenase family)